MLWRDWNPYQRVWAGIVLSLMAAVVVSCYTATAGRRTPQLTLVVRNMTGVIATVRDPWGQPLGKADAGVHRLEIWSLPESQRGFLVTLTGDPNVYPTWQENLYSTDCWQLEIELMDPGGSILRSLQPCYADWATRTDASFTSPLLGHQDSVFYRYQTRRERVIPTPSVQQLLFVATGRCLGLPANPLSVEWRVASAIIRFKLNNDEPGLWVQGLYIRGDSIGIIILDEEFVTDPKTLTHESIHAITGYGDGEPEFIAAQEKCEFGYTRGEV